MPSPTEIIDALRQEVRDLRTARVPILGRISATALGALSPTTADVWQEADPTLMVGVGPSGRLAVTATARLAATGGSLAMGWLLEGPWLDEARTAPIHEVDQTTVQPDVARALTVVAGELAASYTWEHTDLTAGWWQVSARYRMTGTTATATARQLLAAPL